jgi:N-acetylmuramoyl-L-alanine amidase
MPKPGKLLFGLLVVLVGCSTAPRRPAADWSYSENSAGEMEVEHTSESPKTNPPTTTAPATTPPARTNVHPETWIPLARWSRDNHIGTVRRTSLTPLPTFTLTTSNDVFVIQTKSLVAKWNGMDLYFGFEPQLIDDQLFVHVLDLKKNIEPLLHRFVLPEKNNRVIVIDAGHGGLKGLGTTNIVNNRQEKEYTLDWARRLEPLLATNGWRVFLTRTNDADISLGDRVVFADEHKADLFISLHFNSPGLNQAGVETFCTTPTGMPSTLKREFPDDPSLVFPNNAFDAENLKLALRLHEALVHADNTSDHGVKRARFMSVLRAQNRPAVLIEGGFLSNPREARRIDDPAYRQKLAEAVASALVEKSESETGTPVTEGQSSGSPTNYGPSH